jgi:rRNA-processing protein CGR1
MNVDQPIASSSTSAPVPTSIAPSKNGRSAGKAHKEAKTPIRRSYISNAIKTPFEKRQEADKKRAAVKAVEKDMKQEIEDEKER